MADQQTWVEALNINPEKLTEWMNLVPEGTPLLAWCLENDHVSTADYLEWARENYGLPVLDNGYFAEIFDRQEFTTLRKEGPWSRTIFPIGTWEGTTFLACIEPPEELPEGTYALVLADAHELRRIWDKDNHASRTENEGGLAIHPVGSFVLNLDNVSLNETEGATLVAVMPTAAPVPQPAVAAPAATEVQAAPPTPPPTKIKVRAPEKSEVGPAQAPQWDQEFESASASLQPEYSGLLLMKVESNALHPHQWSQKLQAKEQSPIVPLDKPSFFRIVTKTQQPYHGYVVESPIHREFFNQLGLSDFPPSITVTPIMVAGSMWGVAVALGTMATPSAQNLQKCQAACERLAQVLTQLHELQVKKAA
jgi:hypothetical protein